MDFSTSSNGKKKLSALSYAPVPALFRDSLLKTGLLFHVYYENISTKNNFRGRKDFSGNVRSFPYFCLLHLLKGDAYFYNGSTCETSFFQEGSGLLVPPGMLQMYGGVTRPFVEDSICFTGPLPDLMLRSGLLRPGIFYLGGERRLLPVIRAIQQGTLASLLEGASMLVQILLRINQERTADDAGRKPRLAALIAHLNEHPERPWSVEEMADYLNISTNSLRKEFLARQGMSPKHYLDQLWIRHATELLCMTNASVLEIARQMKCADPYYFFRRFRKLTGMSPAQYRKQFPKRFDPAGENAIREKRKSD